MSEIAIGILQAKLIEALIKVGVWVLFVVGFIILAWLIDRK